MLVSNGISETIYTNEYLETIISTTVQWVYENVGITERHIAAANQATSDLARKVGEKTIWNSGLTIIDWTIRDAVFFDDGASLN